MEDFDGGAQLSTGELLFEPRDFRAREHVAAFVASVPGVALNSVPLDVVTNDKRVSAASSSRPSGPSSHAWRALGIADELVRSVVLGSGALVMGIEGTGLAVARPPGKRLVIRKSYTLNASQLLRFGAGVSASAARPFFSRFDNPCASTFTADGR